MGVCTASFVRTKSDIRRVRINNGAQERLVDNLFVLPRCFFTSLFEVTTTPEMLGLLGIPSLFRSVEAVTAVSRSKIRHERASNALKRGLR